ALFAKPLDVEVELVVEHCLQPPPRDITLRVSINGVAHFHVVSRDALRDRPSGAADAEKPAHHLLSGADFRKRSVPARIEVDPQRLRMRINRFLFHVAADSARLASLACSNSPSISARQSEGVIRTRKPVKIYPEDCKARRAMAFNASTRLH